MKPITKAQRRALWALFTIGPYKLAPMIDPATGARGWRAVSCEESDIEQANWRQFRRVAVLHTEHKHILIGWNAFWWLISPTGFTSVAGRLADTGPA